ncbi:metallophosphoesterase [Psychromarinibacter halotolerans]|uniref:Metallophosphoesterase n=1 Tax=Psychromarinibacter halotolerans TaxID=1775175 RepID=A0ABV7H3N9_9RHOB|nr:metallophosphoesterase [Psychromarinibacter halotolerans]MDF0599033.1 metallophosphoesterase [Psychromarinibacter halotolerans]
MSLLRKLFGGRGRTTTPDAATLSRPAPDGAFYAIGDIHGCAGKLSALIDHVNTEAPDAPLVCVGDYVDRGEASAEVLRLLMDLPSTRPGPVICLAGNHEAMLLDALDDPDRSAARWLRHGGLQTLASFGVAPGGSGEGDAMARRLRAAMGDEMLDWVRARPAWWQSGNVAVVHAAADPWLPMAAQANSTLMWGHPEFRRMARTDGVWVVHGHTITDQPLVADGVISIDTGAYAGGPLTLARIADDGVTFAGA